MRSKPLPIGTPGILIAILNALAFGFLVFAVWAAKQADWRFLLGFLAGLFYLYFMTRLVYGVWLFDDTPMESPPSVANPPPALLPERKRRRLF